MKAVVIYESLWGNTAAIARAIAEGIGPEARALSTADATGEALANTNLIVAGAPVHGFGLPTNKGRERIAANPSRARAAPNLSHPSMRSWLASLPEGHGCSAAFETRFRYSPGGATADILRGLERSGYRSIAIGHRFMVKGTYGPLRDGEVERARNWGAELAKLMI